jgi:AraC-like DNA-binding protein
MVDAIARYGGAFYVARPSLHADTKPKRHPELELNLVVRGTARYVLGERRYDLGPGTLVWLFPGQEHLLVGCSRDYCAWLAFFHAPVLRAAQLEGDYRLLLERDPAGEFCRRLGDDDTRTLRGLLEQISPTYVDPTLLRAGLAHLAVAAWSMHRRAPAVAESESLHPAVASAAAMLADDDAADLAAVAAKSGLSESRLRHLFRAETGSSLTDFRNRQRVRRFMESAPRSRRTLLDSALAAGFGSYAQFHRVFRRAVGVSPAAWWKDRS